MSTLITGASGFVGLAMTEHLLKAGHAVITCDLVRPDAAALRTFSRLPGTLAIEVLDVRDRDRVREVMRRHAPQRLVTLAAITADARRERASPGWEPALVPGKPTRAYAIRSALPCRFWIVRNAASGRVFRARESAIGSMSATPSPGSTPCCRHSVLPSPYTTWARGSNGRWSTGANRYRNGIRTFPGSWRPSPPTPTPPITPRMTARPCASMRYVAIPVLSPASTYLGQQ